MIPILFNKDETTFTSLGLGQMDATLVEVERERNGNYTLYAEVPFNSPQAKDLTKEMLIKADAGSRTKWQTFKINRTIKDTNANVIKVYADHISMDTINDAMKPKVVIRQQTAEGALTQWANSLVSGKAYDVQSDITHVGSTEWTIDEVENARQALGGVSGSILDVWGGEYEFDNNRIILHKEMGRTAPTVLEYGRNIVSLEYEELIDGVYTSIYPYATYTPRSEDNRQQEPVMVTLDELIVDSEYAGNYETRRIQIVDFSNEFDSNAENPEIPTQAKLRTLAKAYVKNNGYGIPKISQEIDFVDLSKTLDYQDIQVMEEIELNDRVPVYYPNIDAETNDVKVTTTNWDVLNNRYSKITLSTIGTMNTNSITSKLSTAIKDLKAEQKKINNTVPYLINAQGNRVWWITPDDNMEHKIDDTWFKRNGKYTIIYRWNGSMWEEVLNDETFITEIEAGVSKAQEEAEQALQSAKDADTKANDALTKAGENANLLDTHQNTINIIRGDLKNLKIGGENLIIRNTLQIGYYLSSSGVLTSSSNKANTTTDWIDISGAEELTFTTYDGFEGNFTGRIALYSDKSQSNFISVPVTYNSASPTRSYTFGVPENAKYARATLVYGDTLRYKLQKGNLSTSWSLAPEDLLGKETFQVFKKTYEANDKLIQERLLAIDSTEEGSVVTRLNKTEKTASGNTTTISDIKTKPGEQIIGYQTIKDRSDLYERIIGSDAEGIKSNMARMVMTDSLFKQEVIGLVPSLIGGRNYVLKSNEYYYTNDYKVAEYDLSTIPKGTKIKISLWGGLSSSVRTFGVYVNNSSGLTSSDSQIVELTKLEGVFGQGVSVPLAKWTAEATLNVDAKKILIYGLDNNSTSPKRVEYVQIETGDYYTDWNAAPEDKADMSAITQLEDNINAKVSKEGLISQFNLSAGNALIQVGTNKLNITPETTFIQDATIKSAMIESLEADKITTGTLDAGKVKVINLDANSITANQAKLIQAGFTSSSGGSLALNGDQILSTASDGSQTYMQNGIVGTRNPQGATIGQLGYMFDGARPTYIMRTSLGSHFALNQTFSDTFNGVTTSKEKETIRIMAGGTQYINRANRMDLHGIVYFQNQVNINAANNLTMSGGDIINPYRISLQFGGKLWSVSSNSDFNISSTTRLWFHSNGSVAYYIDSGYMYLQRNLSMQGNKITNQSDRRLKHNIKPTGITALQNIKSLEFVDFKWNSNDSDGYGLIAQDSPSLMEYDQENDIYMINSSKQLMMTSQAVKELAIQTDSKIAQLEAKIASLQDEMALLKGD